MVRLLVHCSFVWLAIGSRWFVVDSWLVPGWFMCGSCLVHGCFMVGSWLVHGWFMAGSWLVHSGFVVGSLLVRMWLLMVLCCSLYVDVVVAVDSLLLAAGSLVVLLMFTCFCSLLVPS